MAVEANSNFLLLQEFSDFIPLGDFMSTKPRLAGQSILPFIRSRPPVKTAVNGGAGNSHRLQGKRSRDSLDLYNPSPVFASAKNTQIVKHHAKKLRMELEERQIQIGEGMVKKLREKDEEIQRMKERVKSLYAENRSLRTNLEQVLAHVAAADERVSCPAVAPVEEDAESCCGSSDHGRGESSVLLLPCRPLCLCTECGSTLMYDKYMHAKSRSQGFAWRKASSNLWKGVCAADYILREGLGIRPRRKEDDTYVEELYWKLDCSGRCSVTSAYNIATKMEDQELNKVWKSIWKLKIPRKISNFVWLLKHKKLMTNFERTRRGFTSDPRCPQCDKDEEDISHCIRDCTEAKPIWEVFLPPGANRWFYTMNYDAWIDFNVSGKLKNDVEGNWNELFSLIAWWVWRWRCNAVFKNERRELSSKIAWIREQRMETRKAFVHQKAPAMEPTEDEETFWSTHGCTTLHTDTSFISDEQLAGCGAVMRNQNGDWMGGFSCTTKVGNATEGELWAIYLGIKWAWEIGQRRIKVITDSLQAKLWLTGETEPLGHCGDLVRWCKEWLEKRVECGHHTYTAKK